MLTLKIALRYFFSWRRPEIAHFIAIASSVAFFGVAMSMVITLSGFNGLRNLVIEGFLWTDPDFKIVRNNERDFQLDSNLRKSLSSLKNMEFLYGAIENDIIVVKGDNFAVAKLRGVDWTYFRFPNREFPLIFGTKPQNNGEAICGASVGSALNLKENGFNRIVLYFPGKVGRTLFAEEAFTSRSFEITGVMAGEQESSGTLLLAPIDDAWEIFNSEPGQYSFLGVYVSPEADSKNIKNDIQSLLPKEFIVLDRMEQQKDVYRILRIEKLAVFIILAFIAIVASFILFGAGSLIMLEKQRSAAILLAMGFSSIRIRWVFFWWMLFVTLSGAIPGILFAVVLCYTHQKFNLISLDIAPDSPPFPVSVELMDLLNVFSILLIIAILIAGIRILGFKSQIRFFQTFKT